MRTFRDVSAARNSGSGPCPNRLSCLLRCGCAESVCYRLRRRFLFVPSLAVGVVVCLIRGVAAGCRRGFVGLACRWERRSSCRWRWSLPDMDRWRFSMCVDVRLRQLVRGRLLSLSACLAGNIG